VYCLSYQSIYVDKVSKAQWLIKVIECITQLCWGVRENLKIIISAW